MRRIWIVALVVGCLAGVVWLITSRSARRGVPVAPPPATQHAAVQTTAPQSADILPVGPRNAPLPLITLRRAIETYCLDHDGRFPTANGEPDGSAWQWELLTSRRVDQHGIEVNPYLKAPVMNLEVQSERVVGKPEKGAGWLLAADGQIGMLDRNGNPVPVQFPPEMDSMSKRKVLNRMIVNLRVAVEFYKLLHSDEYPTQSGKCIAAEWSWEKLVKEGLSMDGNPYKPRIRTVPVNPVTGSSRVVAEPDPGAGWVITSKGEIYGLDDRGRLVGK